MKENKVYLKLIEELKKEIAAKNEKISLLTNQLQLAEMRHDAVKEHINEIMMYTDDLKQLREQYQKKYSELLGFFEEYQGLIDSLKRH